MSINTEDIAKAVKYYIDVDAIADEVIDRIRDHTNYQPYAITCRECGKDLEIDKEIDNYNDLIIQVYPCDCYKEINNE